MSFTKFLYYNLGTLLSIENLINLSSINTESRKVYLSESFWRFKLKDNFQAFNDYKPQEFNYLQWFQNIICSGNSLEKSGTLYWFHRCNDNFEKPIKIKGLVSYMEIVNDDILWIDVAGRLHHNDTCKFERCHTSEIKFSRSKCWGALNFGKNVKIIDDIVHVNDKKLLVKEIVSDGTIAIYLDFEGFSKSLENSYPDRCKTIKRCKRMDFIFLLTLDGRLYNGNWEQIDEDVEYLEEGFSYSIIYKRRDGFWIEYLAGKRFIVNDDSIRQILRFKSSSCMILYKTGDISIIQNYDVKNPIKTIRNFNIQSIYNSINSDSIYLIDKSNNLFVYGSNPYFPTTSENPILVEKDVLQVKEEWMGLAIIKKYGL